MFFSAQGELSLDFNPLMNAPFPMLLPEPIILFCLDACHKNIFSPLSSLLIWHLAFCCQRPPYISWVWRQYPLSFCWVENVKCVENLYIYIFMPANPHTPSCCVFVFKQAKTYCGYHKRLSHRTFI